MTDKFINFSQEVEYVIKILENTNIEHDHNYLKWKQEFITIYGTKNTNLRLYICYAIIFLASILFILEFIACKEEQDKFDEISSNKLIELNDYLNVKNKFDFQTEISFFTPFFDYAYKYESKLISKLISKLEAVIIKNECDPIFKLDLTFQGILSDQIRHFSGEFFTPPFLVKKMVDIVYNAGDKVLDPCCGTGNFLLEIIKRILQANIDDNTKYNALKNIYGFDLNPISIFLTKINILFMSEAAFSNINRNLLRYDFLLEDYKNLPQNFDLIIGNPPWYTLREIDSISTQTSIKQLSERLEIKPLPKNVLNIEIASLFVYQAKEKAMKENGKLMFVITEGVLNGSHAARFRTFKGFENVKIWKFSDRIKKIFNIDFICLFAQKSGQNSILKNIEIPFYYFELKDDVQKVSYVDYIDLVESNRGILIPYSIEHRKTKTFFKKLINKEQIGNLLPIKESYYKKQFHKGADLNPRSLIFVKCKDKEKDFVEITPDKRIFKKAKSPWNKPFFTNEIVEKEYVYNVIKSTELIKFFNYDYYEVFLPLERGTLVFDFDNLKERAKAFYNKINNIYLRLKKETTNHTSLMDNLDRWSKLINHRQRSRLKVIYNNSGSTVNSAVIEGDFLITGDLSFFATNDKDEAYYLSSVLNSDIISNQIKIKKSSRHIFKLPFELPIKKFEKENPTHQKLAELGKKAEMVSRATIRPFYNTNDKEYSKGYIQNIIKAPLKPILTQINDLTLSMLKS